VYPTNNAWYRNKIQSYFFIDVSKVAGSKRVEWEDEIKKEMKK